MLLLLTRVQSIQWILVPQCTREGFAQKRSGAVGDKRAREEEVEEGESEWERSGKQSLGWVSAPSSSSHSHQGPERPGFFLAEASDLDWSI